MDHDDILERVILLLATVILLRLLGIFGALNRAFGPLMPTRGGYKAPFRQLRHEPRG
jgi:hypothetical protein